MSERTADDVIRSNGCNTYVMSCHLNRDDLYNSMREDIGIMCDQYATLKAQNDELLVAAKDMLADLDSFDGPEKFIDGEYPHFSPCGRMLDMKHAARFRAAIANAERPTGC